MIIVDCSSGNTCRNDVNIARQMVFELAQLKIPELVIKWQLFKQVGDNIPLAHQVFDAAYQYATTIFGIPTTASVFDKESLDFLMGYNVPFVKIANSDASRKMIKEIKGKPPLISSDTGDKDTLCCISKYPAAAKEYEAKFGDKLKQGISDHTKDFYLFNKYQPKVYEFHFKLEDSTGLDAGEHARTPKQIKEWLDKMKEINLDDVLASEK